MIQGGDIPLWTPQELLNLHRNPEKIAPKHKLSPAKSQEPHWGDGAASLVQAKRLACEKLGSNSTRTGHLLPLTGGSSPSVLCCPRGTGLDLLISPSLPFILWRCTVALCKAPRGCLGYRNLPHPHVPGSPLALVVGFMSSFTIAGKVCVPCTAGAYRRPACAWLSVRPTQEPRLLALLMISLGTLCIFSRAALAVCRRLEVTLGHLGRMYSLVIFAYGI